MCGVAGLLDTSGATSGELFETAAAMGETLAHRGPDGDGVWHDVTQGVALAHRRLAQAGYPLVAEWPESAAV